MIGAILGDIIGSPHEFKGAESFQFPLIIHAKRGNRATDDSILTIALADTILTGTPYVKNLKEYFRVYPNVGYGGSFMKWAQSDDEKEYGSAGNGAAMRISAVGWAYDDLETTLSKAKEFTIVTHSHESSVRAAQFLCKSIFMLRTGSPKEFIVDFAKEYGYIIPSIEAHIHDPKFNIMCDDIMPVVIAAFMGGESYEECIRLAVCGCNDTDTAACIVGSLAEVIYPIDHSLIMLLRHYLKPDALKIVRQFHNLYMKKYPDEII